MTEVERRSLDVWIAEHVMGWEWNEKTVFTPSGKSLVRENDSYEGDLFWFIPEYSASIEDAWLVVEKFRNRQNAISIGTFWDQGKDTLEWIVKIEQWGRSDFHFAIHQSAPLAICLAAKKMIEERE